MQPVLQYMLLRMAYIKFLINAPRINTFAKTVVAA